MAVSLSRSLHRWHGWCRRRFSGAPGRGSFRVRGLRISGTLLLALLGLLDPASPQELDPGGLFSSDDVIHFTLETDLTVLLNDRSEDSEDRPAWITIPGPENVTIPVQVRTRGSFRLQKNVCSFPPLRLSFQGAAPKGSVFAGQDKIKLVTHCHDRDSYEQNVLEEFLAYRIYNQLTDASFRVRMAEITYLDTGGSQEPLTRMAFFIEDEEALAERMGGMVLHIPGARATEFDPGEMGIMFLFQYMIGNIDWATANTQNLVVFRVGVGYYAIPYDFDWSGLVDAPYAGPSPLTEPLHRSVRERVYLGTCWDELDWPAVLRLFQAKRDSILAVIREVPGLSEYNRSSARDYILGFYRFLENPERAASDLRKICRRG